jgi:hypothetical protein
MSTEDALQQEILNAGKNNLLTLTQMVGFFIERSGKAEFVEMKKNIETANNLIGGSSILMYTSKYFMPFEANIRNREIDYLFNFDYTKLIESNTANDTELLIRSLIGGVKETWQGGDEVVKKKIENYILRMLKYAIIYANCNSKLQKMKKNRRK